MLCCTIFKNVNSKLLLPIGNLYIYNLSDFADILHGINDLYEQRCKPKYKNNISIFVIVYTYAYNVYV